MKTKLFFKLFIFSSVLFSCSDDDGGNEQRWNPGTIDVTVTEKALVEANNGFAINVFNELSGNGRSNADVIVSPISMTYGMSMLAAGAGGDTRAEIMEMLGFGSTSADEVNALCKKLMTESAVLDKSTRLYVANMLLVNSGLPVLDSYSAMIKDCYMADTQFADLSDKDATVKLVNDWCAGHTHGMIPKLLDKDKLSDRLKFITLNAVYFKGRWYRGFDKAVTKDEDFTREDGTKGKVRMMSQTELFRYNETADCQMVALPYGNGSFSMIVMLPKDGRTVADVMAGMDARAWKSDINEMATREVDLKMPRFTAENKEDIDGSIARLGAMSMYDLGKADFSNMGLGNTFISRTLHAVKIVVDEDGTAAAAVTENEGGDISSGPVETKTFHADRPFVYVIMENSTGQIYFMGMYKGMGAAGA